MRIYTLLFIIGSLILSSGASSQIQTTVASLRTIAAVTTQPYFVTDAGKEGLFYYDASDRTTADNGGTVIVNQGSKRYKRLYSGSVDVRWFGAKADYNGVTGTDNAPAINAAMAAAKKLETIVIPAGQYRVFSNISLPLTTVKKLRFEVYGDIYFSKGMGFIIEGGYQEFRSYGILYGMNTGGSSESTYASYVGTGVTIKNGVNCIIEINEIRDFKYGIHMYGTGYNMGCQYNNVRFNTIHHNYVQIRISTLGRDTWNNANYWFGGQVGRGPIGSYGLGGSYGIVILFDGANNPGSITGQMFYGINFEAIEKGAVISNSDYNTFTNVRVEHLNVRIPFDLDPSTCGYTKFVGMTYIDENSFPTGRMGANTIVSGVPLWGGVPGSKAYMGLQATNSITPGKLLVTTSKFNYTSFMVNKVSDLISQTGQYPTVQAMLYRINGVIRSVPFKSTFFHAKTSTAGSPLALPPNIGMVRVETNQAKVFQIDTGDLAINGEEFLVEYLTPEFPISFVNSKTGSVLIPATQFPSGGTYRCIWIDGSYRVSKIGAEYKVAKQGGPSWPVADGTETHLVDYPWAVATVTLPAAKSWPGRVITIKNLQAGKNVQVVGVAAGDESILTGRGAMVVKSDGTSWNIIGMYKRNITY